MIYLFNNQEELIRIVRKSAIKELIQSTELTDENYVSDRLEATIKALDDDLLIEIDYMAIPSEQEHKFHLYYVVKHETTNDVTHLLGVQSAIEELRKTFPIDQQTRPSDRPMRDYAERMLEGTNWDVGYVAEGNVTTSTYYDNVFDVLKKACLSSGLEMDFFAEINQNRIGNRYIDFRKQIGGNQGARVVYGMNGLEIIQESESIELYTALIGRGRGEEIESEDSDQVGYGRKITFSDVEWLTENGDPVDKPKGQQYVEIKDATKQYGIKHVSGGQRPKIGLIEFQDEEDPKKLLELTYEALKDYARPKVTFKTTAVYLDARLGDTVRVVRPDRNLDYSTRVFKITYDRLTNRAIEIILGDKLNLSEGRKRAQLESAITNVIDKNIGGTLEGLMQWAPSADGMTRNFYMEEEPSNPRVGDLWFKPDPTDERHTVLLVWNGQAWEEIVRTKEWNVVEERIKELEALIDDNDAWWEANEEALNEALENFRQSIDKDIEEIVIDEISLSLDDMRSQIEKVSESSRVNAEMIGNDGITRYNKNILKGEFKRRITLEDKTTSIVANDGGFKKGQTYTVSFESICHLIERYPLLFTFTAPIDKRTVDIHIKHTRPLEDVTGKTNGEDITLNAWHGEQTITISNDWYQTVVMDKDITGDTTLEVPLIYREIVQGDTDAITLLEWQSDNELVIQGGL